jgi:hypothetical protein
MTEFKKRDFEMACNTHGLSSIVPSGQLFAFSP